MEIMADANAQRALCAKNVCLCAALHVLCAKNHPLCAGPSSLCAKTELLLKLV
ncbi:hypothetical protein DFR59_1151 [Falsibacillus pallidus]|uniref:Uncharacterized protein n=1 Tax=Falsibacillus pallidus TaxID=493781 RepID=A0A370G5Q8_9BACI|nr:hypothetical protein DFR59_1151 [Falsibacillus pallidus]